MNIYDLITKEFILSHLTEEEIFEKYLGIYPEENEHYTNPFRTDNHPDCKFYRSENTGMLYFYDFAMRWNWDCFNVVQLIHNNCSFKKALMVVAYEFNLLNIEGIEKTDLDSLKLPKKNYTKLEVSYRVKTKNYEKEDLKLWNRWGIDKNTLEYYNVYPAEKVWLKKGKITKLQTVYNKKMPCYVYMFGGYDYKFYYPTRTNNRFIHGNSNIIQGWNQLPERGDYIVITKSLKDVMCMHTFGIPAIAPMSESIFKGIENALPELRRRFSRIFVLMDWDRAGQRFSIYFRKYHDLEILSFKSKSPKDFTDYYEQYGLNYMIDLIEYVKTEYEL